MVLFSTEISKGMQLKFVKILECFGKYDFHHSYKLMFFTENLTENHVDQLLWSLMPRGIQVILWCSVTFIIAEILNTKDVWILFGPWKKAVYLLDYRKFITEKGSFFHC